MTHVVISSAADADLADIWLYSFQNWNADQADRYVALISDAFVDVAAGRRRGKRIPEVRSGYLRIAVGSHVVIYRHEADAVIVIRVLHGRMDVAAHLEE